jgi:hypothetical protein
LPSVQGAALLENTQPPAGMQASSVQAFPSKHDTAVPTQAPLAVQVSEKVQRLPSEHALPASGVFTHAPALHESAVHGLPSPQLMAEPMHCPSALHWSEVVHGLASEHCAPAEGEWMQAPVWALHESAVHALPSLQSLGAPATHRLGSTSLLGPPGVALSPLPNEAVEDAQAAGVAGSALQLARASERPAINGKPGP